jgi:hypothetical protein
VGGGAVAVSRAVQFLLDLERALAGGGTGVPQAPLVPSSAVWHARLAPWSAFMLLPIFVKSSYPHSRAPPSLLALQVPLAPGSAALEAPGSGYPGQGAGRGLLPSAESVVPVRPTGSVEAYHVIHAHEIQLEVVIGKGAEGQVRRRWGAEVCSPW